MKKFFVTFTSYGVGVNTMLWMLPVPSLTLPALVIMPCACDTGSVINA